jgi:hypothetical protein
MLVEEWYKGEEEGSRRTESRAGRSWSGETLSEVTNTGLCIRCCNNATRSMFLVR